MRKVLLAALLFVAGNAFAVCSPHLKIFEMAGEYDCEATVRDMTEVVSATIGGNSLTVVKRLDQSSGPLALATALGKHIAYIELIIPAQYLKYTFTDVLISSLTHSANASAATETVVFMFASSKAAYFGSTRQTVRPTVPQSVFIAGSATPFPLAVKFLEQPAASWHMVMRRDSAGRVEVIGTIGGPREIDSVATRTGTTRPVQQGCTDLVGADGTIPARYVFDANVPYGGGSFPLDAIKLAMPAAGACGTSSPSPGTVPRQWDLKRNQGV